ncbi:c-type cytochrome [Porticoccus sp.]
MVKIKWRQKVIAATGLQVAMVLLASLFSLVTVAADALAVGDFTRGGQLWSENCARCHNMRSPDDLNDEQWITSVFHMRVKAGLTGQETRDILAFLQGTTAQVNNKPVATTTSSSVSRISGKAIYETSCQACHGAEGKSNLPGVPDLTESKGRLAKPDNVLLANIISGLQTPGNLMAMPPKGGNATLTTKELSAAIEYLRSLTGVMSRE